MTPTLPPEPHVVIIGGGFGGLEAAKALRRAPVRVTLVDRRNHHLFQPLLYQVATAALAPGDIAVPIRRILRHQKNASVVLANVTAIDTAAQRVVLDDGALTYDFLIVATGATHSYFGKDAWASWAPGLKTIEDALDIRRRVLLAYEAAERETDPARRAAWLQFVVVGGGPTGVELAGALGEIARKVLTKDFRSFDPRDAKVLLLEAAPRILNAMSPESAQATVEQLRGLGVEVRTGAMVSAIDGDGVSIGAERIPARTVLWAAGVAASPLARTLGVPLDRAGRVLVAPDLSVPGAPRVFVVGDLASLLQDGKPIPGVSPAAMQGGRHAARNIERAVRGEAPLPFHYFDKGTLATIGRAHAVGERGKLRLSGFIAWVFWLFVHVFFLIGFRNRIIVLAEWAWQYLAFERGSRLITGDVEGLLRRPAPAAAVPAPAPAPERTTAARS